MLLFLEVPRLKWRLLRLLRLLVLVVLFALLCRVLLLLLHGQLLGFIQAFGPFALRRAG